MISLFWILWKREVAKGGADALTELVFHRARFEPRKSKLKRPLISQMLSQDRNCPYRSGTAKLINRFTSLTSEGAIYTCMPPTVYGGQVTYAHRFLTKRRPGRPHSALVSPSPPGAPSPPSSFSSSAPNPSANPAAHRPFPHERTGTATISLTVYEGDPPRRCQSI